MLLQAPGQFAYPTLGHVPRLRANGGGLRNFALTTEPSMSFPDATQGAPATVAVPELKPAPLAPRRS